MNSVQIYFIRHGETDWNKARRLQGGVDIPLNENGTSQSQRLAVQLESEGIHFDLIYASPLVRAQKTARIVFPYQIIHPLPGIEEMRFGDLEGIFLDQMTEQELKFYRDWRSITAESFDTYAPNGETKSQHQKRSFDALVSVFSRSEFQKVRDSKTEPSLIRIAVVSHGGTIRRFMEKSNFALTEGFGLGNCEYVIMNFDIKQSLLTFVK